jgi:dihydroorotate dehydrogenase, subfamily 2
MYKLVKPLFFKMDAESAHHLVVDGLGSAARIPGVPSLLSAVWGVREREELAVDLFGLRFSHPVGLAAGLDKNAKAVDGFSRIGLSFMEVGTVTPKGQPGNELPRLFRLPPDEALVNRMGFNNDGAEAMAARLAKTKRRRIPIAVNIGKNKVTPNENAADDYRACVKLLYPHGDFFVVNISSPNTPDLRKLQHGDELRLLLDAVQDEMRIQAAARGGKPKPILVKIAPDNDEAQLAYMAEAIRASGMSGIIATNTTIGRDGLTHPNAKETGGLSGRPLTGRSTEIIRSLYALTDGKLPIIGSGGIFTAQDAYDKIRAGASLVEVYTSMIYKGPGVIKEIATGLRELMRKDGYDRIVQAVGADHRK